MNKKGFTLAEVVVTLGVVGVVAAVTAPSLVNLIPDKNKVQMLKAYKLINDANIELLNDPGFYMTDGSCVGLDCKDAPLRPIPGVSDEELKKIKGGIKYGRLLCHKMHSDGCKVGPSTTSGSTLDEVRFTTPDGIDWCINTAHEINIDIHAASGQSIYHFKVDEHGKVTGDDDLTIQYLKTRDKLNNKLEDYKAAGLKK